MPDFVLGFHFVCFALAPILMCNVAHGSVDVDDPCKVLGLHSVSYHYVERNAHFLCSKNT